MFLKKVNIQSDHHDHLVSSSPKCVCEGCRAQDRKRRGLNNRSGLSRGSEELKYKIKVSAGLAPSAGSEGKSVCASPLALVGLLAIFDIPWLVEASPLSAFIFTWHRPVRMSVSKSPFFIRVSVVLD